MKNTGMLAIVTAVLLAPAAVVAQNRTPTPPPARESGCQMMANWKEQDARLDQLMGQMNRATGPQKTEVIARVLNEMAAQRKTLHEQMGQMKDGQGCGMMGGMMGGMGQMMDHGAMGMTGNGSGAMHQH